MVAIERQRIFAAAVLLYGWYFLSLVDRLGPDYSAGLFVFNVVIALASTAFIFVLPLPKRSQKTFLKTGLWIVVGFLTVATIGLFVYTQYCSHYCARREALAGFNNNALYILSAVAAALTGIFMTRSIDQPTREERFGIWRWAVGVYGLQVLIVVLYWLLHAGPIV